MKSMGEAHYNTNIIYINPDPSSHRLGCEIGSAMFYEPGDKLKIKGYYEECFLSLLHEIAHFKFRKWKIPKEWIPLKRKLGRMHPNNLEMQAYSVEDLFDKFPGELELEDFRHYVIGGSTAVPALHIKVENWAIFEFRKQRKNIRKIISAT